MSALFESPYERFRCLGAECEDPCCTGWKIFIDKETYHEYVGNRYPTLEETLRVALMRNENSVGDLDYALMRMNDETGFCHFFDQGLCKIHAQFGEGALSNVCSTFPRVINEFGVQSEYSLSIACIEAARLVLLSPNGISFRERDALSARPGGKPFQLKYRLKLNSEQMQVVNELRALVIFFLQYREISLEIRLVMLGLLLESMDGVLLPLSSESVSKLPEFMAHARNLLSGAKAIENELRGIEANDALKLKILAEMIRFAENETCRRFLTCLDETSRGLELKSFGAEDGRQASEKMSAAFNDHLLPFLNVHPYILENYVVHSFFQSSFPLGSATPLGQYRQLVFSLVAIKTILTGMAVFHKRMNTEMAVRAIQSFSYYAHHNSEYLPKLVNVLEGNGLRRFRDLFLLVVDRPQATGVRQFIAKNPLF